LRLHVYSSIGDGFPHLPLSAWKVSIRVPVWLKCQALSCSP